MNKTLVAILKVLNKHQDTIIGSREIARQLKMYGITLSERTVRYHLKILDELGMTEGFGKEGRRITMKGRDELSSSLVSEKVGFIISKIDTLSYLTDLNLKKMMGKVILNVSYIRKRYLRDALKIMKPVFSSPYVMSDRVALVHAGRKIGDFIVPDSMVALGTVCSVTINGIFLKAGIPVVSKFGGVLEIENKKSIRFVALISYEGSSLDPHEVFIRSTMTDIVGVLRNGSGRILASFREIPVVCHENAKRLAEGLKKKGVGGIFTIGDPNTPLFEMPVGMDRTGMVVVGGLNPIALLEESGIPTESNAMSVLYEFSELKPFGEI
jgi:repressor of nif and glnA expression